MLDDLEQESQVAGALVVHAGRISRRWFSGHHSCGTITSGSAPQARLSSSQMDPAWPKMRRNLHEGLLCQGGPGAR